MGMGFHIASKNSPELQFTRNGEGNAKAFFLDADDTMCCVQKDRNEMGRLWLGPSGYDPRNGKHITDMAWMHLDITQARELCKALTKFVATGEL